MTGFSEPDGGTYEQQARVRSSPISDSYIYGYRRGYYDSDSTVMDNPYVPSEGEYDVEQWYLGWCEGRSEHGWNIPPKHQSGEV